MGECSPIDLQTKLNGFSVVLKTTMISCKRCTETKHLIKRGRIRSQQRYYCKTCQYHFILGGRRQDKGYPPEAKALAVLLYGTMKSSYGMIARLLGTTRKRVYLWIKKAGPQISEPLISQDITAIEQDNANTRHFLARMIRRTKVVSKSAAMVDLSLRIQYHLAMPENYRLWQAKIMGIF